MGSWAPPTVRVTSMVRRGDTTFVGLRLGRRLMPPLAPASLVVDDVATLSLDAVVDDRGGVTTFRTRDEPQMDLVGREVGLQQWWRPDQLEAVRDTSRRWVLVDAPPPADHEHCLLDF